MKNKFSKRYNKIIETAKNEKAVSFDDAIKKVKENCTAKFNESIDVSFNLFLKI